MKNVLFCLGVLVTVISSCSKKSDQTFIDSFVGTWKLDKIELLQTKKGDTTFLNTGIILKIGSCTSDGTGNSKCENAECQISGKTWKTPLQFFKSDNTIGINAIANVPIDVDEINRQKASILNNGFKVIDQTASTMVLEDATNGNIAFYQNYLGYEYKLGRLTFSK